MEEVEWTKEKVKKLVISLSIAIVMVFIAGLRIIKCDNQLILIHSYSEEYDGRVLIPRTIQTGSGDISLRFFTFVGYSDGYLNYVSNRKGNIKHNLVIRGNKIDNFFSVGINYRGGIFSYNSLKHTPQKFVIEGMGFEDIYSFKVRRMDTDPDTIIVKDFKEIRLTDGTVIKSGSKVDTFFFYYGLEEWELHHRSDKSYFIATNPMWEEDKHLYTILFEKNWGKIISYEEAEVEDNDDW
jgi:hypothetical protein